MNNQPTHEDDIFKEKRKPKNPIKFKLQLNEEQKSAKAKILESTITLLAGAAGSGGTAVEYLDYVVASNTHRQPTQARNDVRILRTTADPLYMTWDLSDHFPVMGQFNYSP